MVGDYSYPAVYQTLDGILCKTPEAAERIMGYPGRIEWLDATRLGADRMHFIVGKITPVDNSVERVYDIPD